MSKFIGALFGDLLIGNKRALIIGGVLQTLGCLLFCFQSMTFLYIGIVVFVIGNGFYSPNVMAQFGKQYLNKPKLLDSGFTGYYTIINIGAFVGVLILGLIAELNYGYGFALTGMLMFISTVIAYFTNNSKTQILKDSIQNNIGFNILYIFIAVLFTGIFWAVYETSSGFTALFIGSNGLDFSFWYNLSLGIGILFGFAFAIIWTLVYTNQFFKFFLGLLISAFSFGFLLFSPENSIEGNYTILIISMIFLALGEVLVAPMLYSITTKYTRPKYLAIMLSVVAIPILLFNKLAGLIGEYALELNRSTIFIFVTAVLFFFGLTAFGISMLQKHNEKQSN